MVPQTNITEIKLEGLYAVAHHAGPSYTGPTGGFHFERGLVNGDKLVSGADIRNRGLANITHYWEAKPHYSLSWNGEVWVYASTVAPPPIPAKPVAPAPPPEAPPPEDTKKKGRTTRKK